MSVHANAGDRLQVTYAVSAADPERLGEAIRVEQTIEFPHDLAPEWIRDMVVGRIEEIDGHLVRVSYDPRVTVGGVVQLLNVLWGNVSLFEGVRIVGLHLPEAVLATLPGPRFGVDGLRSMFDAPARPLLATALKPMGLSSSELAQLAGVLADSGFDLIKDDHGLADQPWARWEDRVARCGEAVRLSNERTGGRGVYMPSLNVPASALLERAHRAKDLGAGALLVLPGLVGFDAMRALAEDDDLALPLMSHPSMLGSNVVNPGQGWRHGLLLGLMNRLCGADCCVFPNYGGRFSFSTDQCADVAAECARPVGDIRAALPAPGGGMTLDRIGELIGFYGPDVMLLVGGALHRGDLASNARAIRQVVAG